MSTFIPSLPSLPLLSLPDVPLSFTLPPSTSAVTNTTGTSLNPSSRSSRRPPHPSSARGGSRSEPRRSTPAASSSSRANEDGGAGRAHGTRAWAEANARGGLERALNGRLPFGMDLVQEERDLSDEEDEWEDKNQNICEFGHTFLVPFGFRKTQEEIDAVQSRSPSPSPPSNAEDLNSAQEPIAGGGGVNDSSDTEEDPDEQPDLDADVEDADGSAEGSEDEEESNGSMTSG
ncbi:hypothetical protein BDY24DRAFT_399166 [Mrakia frigida]|uniref:uncharacterized protein n=1 Tax=Mrakia frigida TaxID=29902 RepID=UPI003FCC2228